jgi:hypothetical protein
MKVAVITANLGGFDPQVESVEQSIPVDTHRFTNENFPPRFNAMTPRLQARIPKCFGWELRPDYDYYIWHDSSVAMLHKDSAAWFLKQCAGYDCAFFLHPDRKTIREEANFIKRKISEGNQYLASRYAGEFLDEAMAEIEGNKQYVDDTLYATTAFVYLNTFKMRAALTHWWTWISRYHTIDQIQAPYVLRQSGVKVNLIRENYLKIPWLTYVRNRRAA